MPVSPAVDETRVKLLNEDNDYINANLVKVNAMVAMDTCCGCYGYLLLLLWIPAMVAMDMYIHS